MDSFCFGTVVLIVIVVAVAAPVVVGCSGKIWWPGGGCDFVNRSE